MDRMTAFFTGLEKLQISSGGTFSDRINYRYTTLFTGAFAVSLMALQYIGGLRIHCFCPAHFTDAMVEYTNKVGNREVTLTDTSH